MEASSDLTDRPPYRATNLAPSDPIPCYSLRWICTDRDRQAGTPTATSSLRDPQQLDGSSKPIASGCTDTPPSRWVPFLFVFLFPINFDSAFANSRVRAFSSLALGISPRQPTTPAYSTRAGVRGKAAPVRRGPPARDMLRRLPRVSVADSFLIVRFCVDFYEPLHSMFGS